METILIIEDDLAIQKAMKITLEQNHYSVKAESDGQKGYDKALIENLDLYARKETRLIIVDTLTRLYRVVLEDRKATYAAHRELNRQTGLLKGLAKQRDIAILCLNQVRSKMQSAGDIEPVAGNILDYWSDYVIKIRSRQEKGGRLLKRFIPEGELSEVVLYLTQSGFSVEQDTHEKQ